LREVKKILATDCGSTTTKAILIEKEGDEYRLKVRGEAPTTVESPFDDVTIGVLNAVTEVEELSHKKIIENGRIIKPSKSEKEGVDLYLSTSSAGGGLQMAVAGVVRSMTAESAERAALGAGAIVMDVLAIDDRRKEHERITRIRHLRPDIILLSGGIDGGTKNHVVTLAETIVAADPKPRFGTGFRLPVIYAGNKDAAEDVRKIIADRADFKVVDNIRPILEKENLQPAREAIHEVFLTHVMSHAPGYDKLMTWADEDIMSTPAAVGEIVQTIARTRNINVLATDPGGATTDVFSVFAGTFNRTVSANLGLSYSLGNVLLEAGMDNICRWLPFIPDKNDVKNRLRNKMIRPTTIPQALEDLLIEQAVGRECLRLAFAHHCMLAVGLKGIQQQRTIADTFAQLATGQTLIDMLNLQIIVGSGGILSHAPLRSQAALMLIDGFQPEGVTELAVDSIFMMPQLGVLSKVMPEAAIQVFHRDCLIYLGTCIAPRGEPQKEGATVAKIEIQFPDGKTEKVELKGGEMRVLPLPVDQTAKAKIQPARKFDVGAGPGEERTTSLRGGVVGIILDGRGRPLILPEDQNKRVRKIREWLTAFSIPFLTD
jgi:uncharacterized protein (TIGR01319 family)